MLVENNLAFGKIKFRLLSHCIKPCLAGLVDSFRRGREVADIVDFIVDERQEEIDVVSNLWPGLHDACIGVDEKRAGHGIFTAFRSFGGDGYTFEGDWANDIFILLGVGIAKETDGIGAACDSLNEDVVIFAEINAGGGEDGFLACLLIVAKSGSHDFFDKVVEGA